MRFLLLGPLEVRRADGGRVELRRLKLRQLLAYMLLNRGRAVSTERLSSALWGERPPASAHGNLKTYVSMLRNELRATGASIRTVPSGYRLDAPQDSLDVVRFEEHRAAGAAALARGDHAAAARHLRAAAELWRGPALEDLVGESEALRNAATLLDDRLIETLHRLAAVHRRLGEYGEAVAWLRVALAIYPLHERLWADLMIALYEDGRRGDALAAYLQCRDVLTEQLGVEPGPHLAELHQRILAARPPTLADARGAAR